MVFLLITLIAIILGIVALIFRWRRTPALEMQQMKSESLKETVEQVFVEKFRISIAHPKMLSKGFTSSFIVQIYMLDFRSEVLQMIASQFINKESTEHTHDSTLKVGEIVKVKLFSPVIDFSDPAIKKLDTKFNTISFLGKPKDSCNPGMHHTNLCILDEESSIEYHSINFSVQISDFAFDHISRPLLSKVISVAAGIGSLTMFILTLLGKIDSTLGLASGTTAGALASSIYIRFLAPYRRRIISIPELFHENTIQKRES